MGHKSVGGSRQGWGNAPITDEIRLRAIKTLDQGGNPEARVEVLINGVALSEILGAGDMVLPLAEYEVGTHLELWGPYGQDDPESSFVEDGDVAVLTCSCGTFGCGGATAKIIFTKERVVWDDFRGAYNGEQFSARPIVFSKRQYLEVLQGWGWED